MTLWEVQEKMHRRIPSKFAHMLKNLRVKSVMILPDHLLNTEIMKIKTTCPGIFPKFNLAFLTEKGKPFVENKCFLE